MVQAFSILTQEPYCDKYFRESVSLEMNRDYMYMYNQFILLYNRN